MAEIHHAGRIERSGGRLGFFVLTALLATAIDIGAFVLLGEGGLGRWQRLAIALMPLPGNITLIVLVLRAIRRLDEFQKRVHFEAVTVAFLSTGVAVFVYGYLQKAQAVGPFNGGFIWLLMALFYGIGYLISTSLQVKNRIRVLRAERAWTQAYLADAIGVSRQAIVAVENGKYDPALPLAFRIARAFGKNVEEVFVWDDSEAAQDSPFTKKEPKRIKPL